MMGILEFSDKDQRDRVYERLRASKEPNERAAVKWSDPKPVMVSESEFKLDSRGYMVYTTAYFIAYPQSEGYIRPRVFRGGEVVPNLKAEA